MTEVQNTQQKVKKLAFKTSGGFLWVVIWVPYGSNTVLMIRYELNTSKGLWVPYDSHTVLMIRYELNTSKGLDDYRTLKMNCM